MQCHILGPLRVVDDAGDDRTPQSDQQRRVLTLLAARAPGPVSTDALEDLLWPDGAPSRNALQALVSKLRRAVAPATIDGDAAGYALRGATIDADEFDRLVAAGRPGDAEALVRGRPVDDLGEAAVAHGLRARLEARITAARVHRLEAAVDTDPLSSLAELRELVAVEPLVETWWRLLMSAEYGAGRAADALRTYQRARATLAEQLGVEPGPDLVDLERRILDHDATLPRRADGAPSPVGAPGVPIPARLSSFVGRADDLEALGAAIAEHRLVTIVGPGGVGKTTTSLELARRVAPDEARWLALAPLTDGDAIVRSLARAVGLPESEAAPGTIDPYADPVERITDGVAHQQLLIVVDNCEHVVAEIADIVQRLLTACPGVRVVASSREPLGVPGERVFPLSPLGAQEAVGLFEQRARDHGVDVSDDDADRIRTLCARLDGLPLAIELAAARLRTTTVGELVDGLSDRFGVLSRGPRTVDDRQRSLRAVVDWSHDLLEPTERVVFRRLAVFVGGSSAAAARAVCAGGSPEGITVGEPDVDVALARLVDKSLVVASRTAAGIRFHLLETLRAYARERLVDAGELESTSVRHAEHVADLVAPAMRGLLGSEQQRWLGTIATERQNIEVAVDTAIARDDAQLALEILTPLGWYFFMVGELEPGSDMFREALACAEPAEPELRATALAFYGWLASNGPSIERAVTITSEAVSLLEHVHDPWVRALIADLHAMSQFFAGRLDSVERSLPELERLAAESGDPWAIAITKLVVAEVVQFRGDSDRAEQEYIDAAEVFDAVGDRFAYALAITEASEIAEQFGHYDRAVEMLERGVAIADEVGFSSHPSAMRARLGNIELLRGNVEIAERHHRSLLDDPVAVGVPWLQAMARFGLSLVARRRGDLDAAAEHLEAAWELPRSQSVPYLRSLLLAGKGFLADQRGDAAAAIALQRAALETSETLRTPRGLAYAFEGCAGALALVEDRSAAELGARLLGHADRLRRESGGPMPAAERFDVDRAEGRLRDRLGDEFDTAFEAGAAIDADVLAEHVRRLPTDA